MSKRKDGQARGQYTLEFKLEAVRLVKGGQAVPVTAKIVGVPTQTLGNWVRLSSKGQLKGAGDKLRLKIFLIVILALAVIFLLAVGYGAFRWEDGTRELRARLDAARVPLHPQVVDFRELDDLPPPVKRFFRNVLKDGQPMVAGAKVRHSGTFNLGETTDQWKSFTSSQQVITQRPGFDWDGRVSMMPGFQVRVHDAYVAGEGILHATLFGLFSMVNLRGTGDVGKGELMRFFSEAAWYPTALLPEGAKPYWRGHITKIDYEFER